MVFQLFIQCDVLLTVYNSELYFGTLRVSIATCIVNNQRLLWFVYSVYSIDLHITRMCVNFVYISSQKNFFFFCHNNTCILVLFLGYIDEL